MALKNSTNNGVEKKYTNVKLVSTPGPVDKTDGPKFVELGEDYKETGKTYTVLEGKVTWIKSTFTPKKGKMGDIYGFKAFVEDGDEVVVIESTITNASKDLLNALIGANGEFVVISLYVNKNGYPTSSVRNTNGEYITGALDFKSLNGPVLKDKIDEIFVSESEAVGNSINIEDVPF